MSDRLAVFNRGRIEQLGTPADLYERPATAFVAGFVGTSNLLRGDAAKALVGQEGLFTVRPEKIRITEPAGATPPGHNRLTGVISDASYLGVSTQYQVDGRGGARVTVYEQNVERATRSELWARGEEVQLSWSPDHTFVVHDRASGKDAGETLPGIPAGTASAATAATPG